MDEKKIYEILNDIFRDVFDDDELTVTKDIVLQPKNLDIKQLIIKDSEEPIAL